MTSEPSVIEERLSNSLRHHTGHRASPAEMRSWSGSLPNLAQDLVEAGLSNVEVMLEYRLPLTSKRADVVLAGRHPRTGAPSYVVVELKQWSAVLGLTNTKNITGASVPEGSQYTQILYGDGSQLVGYMGAGVGHFAPSNPQVALKFFGLLT